MSKRKVSSQQETEAKCAWESGDLGSSVAHAVAVSAEHESSVDEALGLQMISIRLPRALIDDLKYFAKQEGLGYQPLMRRVLMRYVSHEYKNVATEQLVSGGRKPARKKQEGQEDEAIPMRVASR